MLSGLSSYLFGAPSEEEHPAVSTASAAALAAENTHFKTKEEEDEWTIVDKASSCGSPRSHSPAGKRRKGHCTPTSSGSSCGSSQYRVHANTPTDTDCSSDDLEAFAPMVRFCNPSMVESWLVTPPPCFTAGGSTPVRHGPMENLLIEHPSMSVYQRGQGSEGESEESSDSSMDTSVTPPSQTVAGRGAGRGGPKVGSRKVTGRAAGLIAPSTQNAVQSSLRRSKEARSVARHTLQRHNKVQQYNSSSKSMRRRHHQARTNSGKNNDRKCQ